MEQEQRVARFFDDFAEAFDTLYDSQRGLFMRSLDRKFRGDMFVRFARTFEAFGDLTDKTVLDIGCGSGPYVIEACRRSAAQVTALDAAPSMLALVQKRLERTEFMRRCSLVKGVFPDVSLEQHDYAIVMGVMDYVSEPAAFLQGLRPLVRISAAVSFPSRHWFRTPLRKVRYRLRNCPVFFYNAEQIRELGRSADFEHVDMEKIPGAGMDYHVLLRC